MNNDYLAHYGVLGMKWGIRRYQPYSEKPRKSGKSGREVGEARKGPSKKAIIGAIGGVAGGAAAVGGTAAAIKSGKLKVDVNKALTPQKLNGKDKASVSPAEKTLKEAGNIASKSGNLYKTVNKARHIKDPRPVKKLSEEELQRTIKRLDLEKRYEELTAADVAKGKITAQEIFDAVGDSLAIAGSIATIIAMYKLVKG